MPPKDFQIPVRVSSSAPKRTEHQLQAAEVPARISSKKRKVSALYASQKVNAAMDLKLDNAAEEEETLEREVAAMEQSLRVDSPLTDQKHCQITSGAFNKKARLQTVKIQASISDFKGSREGWIASPQGQQMLMSLNRFEATASLFEQRQKEIGAGHVGSSASTAFFKLFTTSKIGLGLGKIQLVLERSKSSQRTFRNATRDKYNAYGKNPKDNTVDKDVVWCPVLRTYYHSASMITGHIWPWSGGEDVMWRIFGIKGEMMHPNNAIVWHQQIEKLFEAHLIALVPDLDEDDRGHYDLEQVTKWQNKDTTREYKVKIFRPDHDFWSKAIWHGPYNGLTYKDLDGKRLEFKSDHRPRSRYLYGHYLCCYFIHVYHMPNNFSKLETWAQEMNKPVWGTQGRYIRRPQLKRLIEAVGHQYGEALDTHAIEDPDATGSQDDLLMTVAASSLSAETGQEEIESDVTSDGEDSEDDEPECNVLEH